MYLEEEIKDLHKDVDTNFTKELNTLAGRIIKITEAHVMFKTVCGPITDLKSELGSVYTTWVNLCATIGLDPESCVEESLKDKHKNVT